MPGQTNQIATALAVVPAAIAGITTSATPQDGVPGKPFLYVSNPSGTMTGGSWERIFYIFPVHCLVGFASTDRDAVAINDLWDLIRAAFRTGISLGVAGVVSAEIHTFDLDKFYTVSGVVYQSVDLGVGVEVDQPESYTP